MTARQLAEELEVSTRTVLRDIEALSGSGVPVYAVRGRDGGFELLEGFRSELGGLDAWAPATRPATGAPRRAAVRVSPEGRRLAAVLGRLQPLRLRRVVAPDGHGWVEATFRRSSLEADALDVLSLGPEIEVLAPAALRERVATLAAATAARYAHG